MWSLAERSREENVVSPFLGFPSSRSDGPKGLREFLILLVNLLLVTPNFIKIIKLQEVKIKKGYKSIPKSRDFYK